MSTATALRASSAVQRDPERLQEILRVALSPQEWCGGRCTTDDGRGHVHQYTRPPAEHGSATGCQCLTAMLAVRDRAMCLDTLAIALV